ncbi:MAG TPA: homocysteine S-methyltransferase family protein [Candidatus Dormibacteraeota bacterium]|nr:homocysteine S-methyltransferase family protein [Candidatus Dormibacteraeota bacterium]
MAPHSGSVTPGLLERLREEPVICAEGYLFECERRGYLQAGAFVPEVVLDHPEIVEQLHRDFVHAGSDVVQAFTYYGHREKMRLIGKEELLEPLNRQALAIASRVAGDTGSMLAGGLSNTNVYDTDETSHRTVRGIFEEQVNWAAEAGVDFIIAETLDFCGEALLALEAARAVGLATVVTFAVHRDGNLRDGFTPEEGCQRLEAAGADVVGLNCARGPRTMLPLLKRIRDAVSGPMAALPVPYRTTPDQPTFQSLYDPESDEQPFPTRLDPFVCTRDEIGEFGSRAYLLGVRYLGVCCGAGPHHIRSLAEALGRRPLASRYSPDMSKHAFLGSDPSLKDINREYASRL